jgi:hypothetical protein
MALSSTADSFSSHQDGGLDRCGEGGVEDGVKEQAHAEHGGEEPQRANVSVPVAVLSLQDAAPASV